MVMSEINKKLETSEKRNINNMSGYMLSEVSNRSSENRTVYSGNKNLNLFTLEYIHNDWSREKKTKMGFQGSENRLLRLKAQKTNIGKK